ncbi:hypothetical protein TraAM80_05264 [Trypanosoma rangeli]|uniref:VHS domain-containing protein n=1 Tax=Trypanosoma rangeli TaxID=5698 RepID=A0A422NFG5_TRYRA|nr:uncharacterized protein TraAM80_05264 [Trypanosoma rangeli]RNF04205.1 hypothetical protein TraAM80_05264 [Trypanosoma rangeli]|eukprot:RNF04205.1 hypothetical protein TraAM80_05264 [Trypanosoma rangeli]
MDRSLFKCAVADSEDPTPGYIYREMALWTLKDHNTQMKLIDALFDKLRPQASAHVLCKVLRIIKAMCEMGHSDFQREMQKNTRTEVIKTFANYRGKPDAKHGNSLNEKVRQAAREAMEAAFMRRVEERVMIEEGYGNSGEGAMGRTSFTTGNVATATMVGGSMGVYSGNIAPMPMTNKWAEHMANQAESANRSKTSRVLLSLAEKAKSGFALLHKADPSMAYKSVKDQLYESALKLGTTGASMTSSSEVNAGGFQPPDLGVSVSIPQPVGSISSGFQFDDQVEKREGNTTSREAYSENLHHQLQLTPLQASVQRLCLAKSTPQRVELHAFVEQCNKLGAEMAQEHGMRGEKETMEETWEELAGALDAQLAQKHPWQRRLNALVALEAILRPHVDDAESAAAMRQGVMRYFLENPEDVQRNVFVVQATLRERAQRVLRLLGLPEGDVDGGASALSMATKGEQLQSVGNGMHAFSWAAPISIAELSANGGEGEKDKMVNMSGMSLRANHRGAKNKTTLRRRAPMSLHEEPQEKTDAFAGGSESHVSGHGKAASSFGLLAQSLARSSNSKNSESVGKGSMLDDLFGAPATENSAAVLSVSTAAAPSHACTTAGSVDTHNGNITAFDFLLSGKPWEAAWITTSPQHQPDEEPASASLPKQDNPTTIATSTSALRPQSPLLDAASAAGESRMNHESSHGAFSDNGIPFLATTSSSAPAAHNSLSTVVLEMQQQLQALMSNEQGKPNPDQLAQLQSLMAQQQQLMTFLSQQQQLLQQQHPQEAWVGPSSGRGCTSNVDSAPLHTHFAMGAAPSSTSAMVSHTFAQMQEELMAQLAAEPPGGREYVLQ